MDATKCVISLLHSQQLKLYFRVLGQRTISIESGLKVSGFKHPDSELVLMHYPEHTNEDLCLPHDIKHKLIRYSGTLTHVSLMNKSIKKGKEILIKNLIPGTSVLMGNRGGYSRNQMLEEMLFCIKATRGVHNSFQYTL